MLKKILNPGLYSKKIDYVLFVLRVMIGIFMLKHGIEKFLYLIGSDPVSFPDPVGIGETTSLALAVFAELFCSLLLIFGVATRIAVLPLLFTMLVAVLIVHGDDGFRVKELALLYLNVFIAIAIAGAGKISIDNWLYEKLYYR